MNSNTVVDALRQAGVPSDQPLTLTNPGGNNPWLFSLPASFAANAGAPVVLEVPTVAANGVEIGPLAGIAESKGNWYADGRSFLVRAVGQAAPVAFGKTLKIYLFAGNGLASGVSGSQADVELGLASGTVSAVGGTAAFSNWYIEAKCLWDSASLNLTGTLSGLIGGNVIAATGFSIPNPSAWVAQQAPGAYLPLSFVLGVNMASTAV